MPADANAQNSTLAGRVALVTGVSRPDGIANTVARRLHDAGATVFATGWPDHDAEMPWGSVPLVDMPFAVHRHDLADAAAPGALIDEVMAGHGQLDIVAAVHACGTDGSLAEVTVEQLDRDWAVNVRSVIMLAQAFAAVHAPATPDEPPTGRMLWFTSGQHLGPMESEIAYVASKGALHQMTATLNRALSESRIVANCINPGPVDTGYATGDVHAAVAEMFPDGRWGTPDDTADLVEFLVSDAGGWLRGQVLNSEGGFDRFR